MGVELRLGGKIILVAGGGGIGSELARRYAADGATVVLGDVDAAGARAVADEINNRGARALAVRLDGSDEASVAAAVATCRDRFGGLDGLHANFASFVDGDDRIGMLELPMDVYDETIRINQRGFVLCTRAVLPLLIERGGGVILYTSSIGAYRSGPSRVAYAMAKAAGHVLMRHVAERHGRQGIRANTIAPGTIMHGKWDAELPQEMKDRMLAMMPLRSRLGKPHDIAELSALLMSDAGSFITGQVICVDGGVTMRP